MSKAVSGITNSLGLTNTGAAGESVSNAAGVAAGYQQQALDYLKQTEKLPQSLREGALTGLGGEYGLTIGKNGKAVMNPGSIVSHAEASPFYQTAVRRGEEAVLRNASATGGLRSGSTSENLAEADQNALYAAYQTQLQGLQGLSKLPSNANNIANTMSGIGQTYAQGIAGQAQANAAAENQNFEQLLGLGKAGATAGNFGGFSDQSLKDNISYIGDRNGHKWYSWTWNKMAESLGLSGDSEGVIAQDVAKYMPDAVSERDGYLTVNYEMLGAK
jgi:hypothetical protein